MTKQKSPSNAEPETYQWTVRVAPPTMQLIQEAMEEEGFKKLAPYTVSALIRVSREAVGRKRARERADKHHQKSE